MGDDITGCTLTDKQDRPGWVYVVNTNYKMLEKKAADSVGYR
ncbi:MAG: hypothetical protein ABIU63_09915 [Chitinophagaceae bacterium]